MLIFDIKRYAIHDGPGIRITIFMKGCPLSCVWCHNPEGISVQKQKLYTKKKCIGCGTCVSACRHQAIELTKGGIRTDSLRCRMCGLCTEVCPTLAFEISGKEYAVAQLIKEIEKETVCMDRSGGGVTICGGEPLLHSAELVELLKECGYLGIHRAVDTTLFASADIMYQVMDQCELFLIDLKHMDPTSHKQFCGVSNELILANIQRVARAGHDFYIRIPLIEGINADEENIRQTAEFLSSLPWKRRMVHLLPYHDIGKGKHEKMGTLYNPRNYFMATPSEERIRQCQAIFNQYGIRATTGG